MKYLKRFNENRSIIDFTKEYLAYLIDDGFECMYYDQLNGEERDNKIIDIKKPNNESFFWKDVKTDILPFVEICLENYEIHSIKVYTMSPNKNGTSMFVYSDPSIIHKSWDKNTYCGTINELISGKASVTPARLMVFSVEFKKEKV